MAVDDSDKAAFNEFTVESAKFLQPNSGEFWKLLLASLLCFTTIRPPRRHCARSGGKTWVRRAACNKTRWWSPELRSGKWLRAHLGGKGGVALDTFAFVAQAPRENAGPKDGSSSDPRWCLPISCAISLRQPNRRGTIAGRPQ